MKQFRDRLRHKALYTLFRQNWNIGVVQSPVHEVAGLSGRMKQNKALAAIRWMEEQRGWFRADPFPAPGRNGSDLRIFHEAYDWSVERGRIDFVDFSVVRGFGQPVVSMTSPGHLSYPFIFKYNGIMGYLPEHSSMQDLSFFPIAEDGIPIKKITIFEGLELVDSTIVEKDDLLWLFATIAGLGDNSELHIYYAETLKGPWFMHEANPVKIDTGSARPAGSVFTHRNSLYRPSQDCTLNYGSGIIINEIEILNKEVFCEKAVSEVRLEADHLYNFGIHTLSSAGDFTVVDGARLESKIHPLLDCTQRFFRRL